MREIDEMDMLGFLRIRSWKARQDQARHEPVPRYIDEVWPYRARHDALCDRYESLKARCAELKETISDKQTRLAAIDDFLRTLMKQEALPTAFDPMTYHILVERMTVYGKDKVIVRFKNGMEIQA